MINLMTKMYKMIDEKNVKNKNLIDRLFTIVRGDETGRASDNAFEDDILKQAQAEAFIKKYIEPITDFDTREDMFEAFIETNVEFQRLGFKIGFQTALKLITEIDS